MHWRMSCDWLWKAVNIPSVYVWREWWEWLWWQKWKIRCVNILKFSSLIYLSLCFLFYFLFWVLFYWFQVVIILDFHTLHFLKSNILFIYKYWNFIRERKPCIRRNNNKVDSIETGRIFIAHLLPWSDLEKWVCGTFF